MQKAVRRTGRSLRVTSEYSESSFTVAGFPVRVSSIVAVEAADVVFICHLQVSHSCHLTPWFMAFGRPFIANPDLPERLRLDTPLAVALPETFYGGGARGYTDFQPKIPR